jgi:metallopeptidase MepB
MTSILSRTPPQPPGVFDATPSSILKDANELNNRTSIVWDAIVASVKPENATFENTILPIIHDENEKNTKDRILKFYASTSPSNELRDASNAATTLRNDADVELYLRADMFKLVDVILRKTKADPGNLDSESLYYIEKLHRKFHQNGCGISDTATKQKFEEKMKRLQDLVRQCSSGFHEESTGLWLTLEELDGVPESLINRLKKGDGENEGKVWLTTKVPHTGPVLTSAKLAATRKKVYYAVKSRLPQNIPLFRELVLLRDETARMLGYPNYLAFKTADKMVRNPETVTNLLTDIRQRLDPLALQDAQALLQLKIAEASARGEKIEDMKLFFWDESYFTQIRDEMVQPANSKTSEYFELHMTVKKLLELFGHIFGTRFERITAEQQRELGGGRPLVWQEDVQMYAVWDAGKSDAFMGYAYLDLYPRDGKYTHGGVYRTQWVSNTYPPPLPNTEIDNKINLLD